jgi:uncharacterized membrane protein YGL010W
MRRNLLAWQWSDYASRHRNRANLAIHIVAVPLFLAGVTLLLTGGILRSAPPALAGATMMIVSLILQGRGHKGEAERPAPFDGPLDFVTRFLAEQFVTFPRFVLSGEWLRNFRAAS